VVALAVVMVVALAVAMVVASVAALAEDFRFKQKTYNQRKGEALTASPFY
jgi:type II secretory pathway component PulK